MFIDGFLLFNLSFVFELILSRCREFCKTFSHCFFAQIPAGSGFEMRTHLIIADFLPDCHFDKPVDSTGSIHANDNRETQMIVLLPYRLESNRLREVKLSEREG